MELLLINAMTETIGGEECPSLNVMLRESLPEKVTFKQTSQEDEGAKPMDSWRKSISGGRNSPGTGGGQGECLVC